MSHLDVELCLGSSCYCRGNHSVSSGLQELLARRNWTGLVTVKGCLCREACRTGPLVYVNGIGHTVRGVADLEKLIEHELAAAGASAV